MKFLLFLTAFTLTFINGCSKKSDFNGDIEKEKISEMEDWYGPNDRDSYEVGKSEGNFNGKPVFFLKSTNNNNTLFGTIVKNIYPPDYLEKRIRLSGNIKINSINGIAGMWMRVDGGIGNSIYGKTLSFDNMSGRNLTKPTDWKKYGIVLDVPKESRMIYYGVYLSGFGEISISDFIIETVSKDVPSTDLLPTP